MRVCFISTFHMREKEEEVVLQEDEIQIAMNVGKYKVIIILIFIF
jgi:hypothetical protein